MARRLPKPRGRPPTDPAFATRHRFLALEVKQAAQCGWDALDAQLLDHSDHETRRPRMMWSMAKYGLQPASPRRQRQGFDLMARLRQDGRFERAITNYHSALWDLLTPPELSATARRSLLERLMLERGLFRASPEQRQHGARLYPDNPAFRDRTMESMSDLSAEMDETHFLDKIAIFACAYGEAVDRLDLIEAQSCIYALRYLLVFLTTHVIDLGVDLHYDLCDLLTARVLKNDWTSDLSHFRDQSLRLLTRSAPVRPDNPHERYGGSSVLIPLRAPYFEPPIVFHDAQTRRVSQHRGRNQETLHRDEVDT